MLAFTFNAGPDVDGSGTRAVSSFIDEGTRIARYRSNGERPGGDLE